MLSGTQPYSSSELIFHHHVSIMPFLVDDLLILVAIEIDWNTCASRVTRTYRRARRSPRNRHTYCIVWPPVVVQGASTSAISSPPGLSPYHHHSQVCFSHLSHLQRPYSYSFFCYDFFFSFKLQRHTFVLETGWQGVETVSFGIKTTCGLSCSFLPLYIYGMVLRKVAASR